MEAPQKIEPQSLADYLEVMCKAVFQSGMSWAGSQSEVARHQGGNARLRSGRNCLLE